MEPSDFFGQEISAPGLAMQSVHSERLQMVGAVDKTETRGVMEQERSAPISTPLDGKRDRHGRPHWDFSNLSTSSTGSKRSMTVNEVRLIQSIGQAVICTDLEGNITYWNRAAESIYLWKAEEAVGQNVAKLLSPRNGQKDLVEVIGKVSNGESWSGPYPALRKDGVVINTVFTDTPIVDNHNKIVGIIGVSFDVSSIPMSRENTISRSLSDEGLILEDHTVGFSPTGSDDGKNMLSGRRGRPEEESIAYESFPESKPGAGGSNNYMVSFSTVQQLLRKLQIGTGQREGDFPYPISDRESPREELGFDYSRRGANVISNLRTVEHSQTFPVYVPNESTEADFGEGDNSSIPLVIPAKQPWRGEGGSYGSSGSQEEVKEIMVNSTFVPKMGTDNNSLSRSSSGSATGSAAAPDASSVGSSNERNIFENLPNALVAGLDFQQAGKDFQLQLALALRLAAEAAAVDDPDLAANVRGPRGGSKLMPGISLMEALSYRYWVSSCMSYDDHIEDGFYEVWGMSPYVWSMCTDLSELGRMPPLENLRAVAPGDASFEVVLVERSLDPALGELEDKAVRLAYESTDVLDMASELSIMVANVMGGPAESDEQLAEAWDTSSKKLMQKVGTVVLPIGALRVGLSRHRALLFKVLADSVGLACRLVRGSSFDGKEQVTSLVVKYSDEKEWMIDLLVSPGTRMAPDKRLAAPPTVIPSPLQFERLSPFGGSNVSVLDWTRGEQNQGDGDSKGASPQRKSFPEVLRTVGPLKRSGGSESPAPVTQGLDFLPKSSARGASNTSRGSNEDGLQEKYGLVNLQDRRGLTGQLDPKPRSTDPNEGKFFLENVSKTKEPQMVGFGNYAGMSGSPREDNAGDYEQVWAREGRQPSGLDDSGKRGSAGRMLNQIASDTSAFEIAWEDIEVGERIGQGSYGRVYRADWQGSDVAVKVFLDQDIKTEALEEFKSEVAIMSRLRHPNIVLFMGAVTKPPNLSIITEFCPRGSLYRLLHRPNRELNDIKRMRMAMDVAKGMNYLHRCSPPVVHRDLKSPNLLVDKNWIVKVADFGLSKQKHNTYLTSKSSAGTPEWMAPEVLRNELSNEKADVFSYGVILWELVTLKVPWDGKNQIQVVGAVGFSNSRLQIPENVDPGFARLIEACWDDNMTSRPSFADIMQELKVLMLRPLFTSPSSPSPQSSSSEVNVAQ